MVIANVKIMSDVMPTTPQKGITEEPCMLWTISIVLLVLWALGLVSSNTLGGYIHLLLVIAVVVVLSRIIRGRRPR